MATAVGRLIIEGKIIRFGQLFNYMTKTDWAKVWDLTNEDVTSISIVLSNIPKPKLLLMVRRLRIKPSELIDVLDAQKAFDRQVFLEQNLSETKAHVSGRNVRPLYCPVYPTGPIFPVSASIFITHNLSNHDKRHINRPGTKENGAHKNSR